MQLGIDIRALEGFTRALREAPRSLLRHLARAYQGIGRYDIERLRESLPGRLNIRSKGLAKSFKFKATDPSRADDFSKLFTSEYTGWKAAKVFETGGTITGKGKQLTVLFDAGRNASGRRKYTQQALRNMVASGKVSFVPTPRGTLIIQHVGGVTKTGKGRKNSRDIILGMLKRSVTERKRLDFVQNAIGGEGVHQQLLEEAVENALKDVAAGIGK